MIKKQIIFIIAGLLAAILLITASVILFIMYDPEKKITIRIDGQPHTFEKNEYGQYIDVVLEEGRAYEISIPDRGDYSLSGGETLSRRGDQVFILLPGESLGINNRYMMTKQVKREDITSVEVYNKYGTYTVVKDKAKNLFFMKEAPETPVVEEMLTNLITNTGYLLAMTRVAARGIDEGDELLAKLDEFGLSEADDPVWFKVTINNGESYKVFVGGRYPAGTGYYAMLEGRAAIYMLDTMFDVTVMSSRNALLFPIVAPPISQNEYFYIDNFTITKNGEDYVRIIQEKLPEDSIKLAEYKMVAPAEYVPSPENFDAVLQSFIYLVGNRVVESRLTKEIIESYGFDDNSTCISFTFKGLEYYIYVSRLNQDGKYYVMSLYFDSIVEVEASVLGFIEWDIIKFVDRPIFMKNINDVESITVESGGRRDVFLLQGSGSGLTVSGNGKLLTTDIFRQYYKSILYITLQEYEPAPSTDVPVCSLTIKMRSGDIYDFKFYYTATLRCYYTINGTGDFYVLRDRLIKFIDDTALALNDVLVKADEPE